jgi:hypothetical protein
LSICDCSSRRRNCTSAKGELAANGEMVGTARALDVAPGYITDAFGIGVGFSEVELSVFANADDAIRSGAAMSNDEKYLQRCVFINWCSLAPHRHVIAGTTEVVVPRNSPNNARPVPFGWRSKSANLLAHSFVR